MSTRPKRSNRAHRSQGSKAQQAGASDEQRIESMHESYRLDMQARITKRDPPMKQVGKMRGGRFSAIRTAAGGADYSGTMVGGRAVVMEAKGSSTPSIPLTRHGKQLLSDEQRRDLRETHALGGLACLLCKTTHTIGGIKLERWWVVAWPAWRACEDAAKAEGRKSVPSAMLGFYGAPVPMVRGWPDWLPVALALGGGVHAAPPITAGMCDACE
jgi:recombination protein U